MGPVERVKIDDDWVLGISMLLSKLAEWMMLLLQVGEIVLLLLTIFFLSCRSYDFSIAIVAGVVHWVALGILLVEVFGPFFYKSVQTSALPQRFVASRLL
ncbi:hypothetical protein EDD21DRAFT_380044, partial [Dissophora ornata]